jgi:polyferredoxin
MEIIEEIKNIKSDESEWKKFGLTMGIILAIIGFFLFWKRNDGYPYLGGLAAVSFVLGLFLPSALKYVYKGWMILAVVLGFIMTKVIMAVTFYLIVTPLGLIASLTGKEFLDMKIDRNAKSYWIPRETTQRKKSDYERQF